MNKPVIIETRYKPARDMKFLYAVIGPDKKATDHKFLTDAEADAVQAILNKTLKGYSIHKVTN